MSFWSKWVVCPKCETGHDIGDYPDHLHNARLQDDVFEFECEACKHIWMVEVDWTPAFRPSRSLTSEPV